MTEARTERVWSDRQGKYFTGEYGTTPLNRSGFQPLDLRVLVKPDEAQKKTAGGILLPDDVVEKDGWAQAKGTLVAIGENAWEEAAARGPHFTRPQPGDRILYGKYAGHTIEGVDGEKYRIMNDEDVLCRLVEQKEA